MNSAELGGRVDVDLVGVEGEPGAEVIVVRDAENLSSTGKLMLEHLRAVES